MSGSGDLDHLLKFLRPTTIDDGTARVPGPPEIIGRRWASRRDVGDVERVRAGQLGAELDARFVVRGDTFTRGLARKDQFECRSPAAVTTTFWVSGIRVVGERGEDLEISASAQPDLAGDEADRS